MVCCEMKLSRNYTSGLQKQNIEANFFAHAAIWLILVNNLDIFLYNISKNA